MPAAALQDLMAELMVFVVSSTGYGVLPDLPEVAPVARPQLEQRVCGKPCPVMALFDSEEGILVDDSLDLLDDPAAQSVLLHELVHVLQWHAAGGPARQCEEWAAREREAYRVQFAWLASRNFDGHRSVLPRPVLSLIRCQPGGVQATEEPGSLTNRATRRVGRPQASDPAFLGRP